MRSTEHVARFLLLRIHKPSVCFSQFMVPRAHHG